MAKKKGFNFKKKETQVNDTEGKGVGQVVEETSKSLSDQIESVIIEDVIVDEPVTAECGDDCECHDEMVITDIAVYLKAGGRKLEVREDGVYMNGELCNNPTTVFNFLHMYGEEFYAPVAEEASEE